MVLEVLERPDVRVFQEFGPEAPSLIRPLLEAAIVGEAFQIVTKGEAGKYFGGVESFLYPGKILGAVVQIAEVKVFLQQGTDEFDITTATGVVIDATDVDLPAALIPELDVQAQKQVAATLPGNVFTDETADFVTAGVKVGDILNFILTAPELIEGDSVISAQTGDFTVLNVNSPTELEVDPILIAETLIEYEIIRKGTSTGDVKITYRAARVDLVGQLIEVQTQDERETVLGPADPLLNPLSFGVFMALLHTDSVVAATAISGDTLVNWTTAAEFLESKEIYGIAPLTQRADVHQMFQKHVVALSKPENKKERIVLVNPTIVDNVVFSTILADGDVTAASDVFTSALAQFQTDGVPVGAQLKFTVPVSIGGSLVSEVTIAAVLSETTVRMIADADATVSTISYTVESKDFTLLQKALNVKGIGEGFKERRVVMIVPDIIVVTDEATSGEVDAPGYFLGAAEAGLISGSSPSQGFTNFPFAGILALKNSNFTFNETQLGVMAAGGAHIFIQETLGGAVTVRHQLTTDVSTVQRRELSIVKTVDFMAKFLRNKIRLLIGINNITDTFLNNILRPQTNAIIEDLVEDRIIGRETKITRLLQDPVQKDTVIIDITVEVLFPANFIDYTLII